MVRDSTHRPRNTDELLSMAARMNSQQKDSTSKAEIYLRERHKGKEAMLINFFSNSTNDGQEEEGEGEEGSDDGDTIVQLKDHSLDENIQSTIDELQRNSLTLREVNADEEGDNEIDHRCTENDSTTLMPIPSFATSNQQQQQHHHQDSTLSYTKPNNSTYSQNEQQATSSIIQTSSSSCLATTSPQIKQQKTFNEFGVPVFDKSRPLFSESVRQMQRWRNLQGKFEGGDFPQSDLGIYNSSSSLVLPQDREKERSRCQSADGSQALPNLSNAKLPRPKSWMSNLLSVGSNSSLARLATTPMTRQRYHSFDGHPGQDSASMPPVSSLVLQDQPREMEDTPTLEAPWQFLGNLQAASFSTPTFSEAPSSPGGPYSRRAAPLFVRNLDSAPRGAFTPTIPFPKSTTRPWNTFERDLGSRKDLIDAEEEENMISDAVAEKRKHGGMAGEERAVLDMLDQMNNSVDTFDRPSFSRAQSQVSSSLSRLPNASTSPARMSVKAFANALDQNDASSRSSSPVRNGRESPTRPVSSQAINESSLFGRQGGVKKVISDREKLDISLKVTGNRDKPLPPLGSSSPDQCNRGSMLSPPRPEHLRQDSASTVSSYASQTNAFLNRRATHAADKQITHSPSLSFASSDQGSSTTFWSKKGYTTESPITSPDLPAVSEDKTTFRFDVGKLRDAGERPFLRRMMTNETGVTSPDASEVSPSPSKQSSNLYEDKSRNGSPVHAIDYATPKASPTKIRPAFHQIPFKAASQSPSSTSTGKSTTATVSLVTTMKTAASSLDTAVAQSSIIPSKLSSSPKKGAKDLIRFYEQTSAPSSPQQSPTRNSSRINTPVATGNHREPLTTLAYNNSPGVEKSKFGEKAVTSPLRQKARSRGWLGSTEGSDEMQNFTSDSSSQLDERSSRKASGSVLRAGSMSTKSWVTRLASADTPSSSTIEVGEEPQIEATFNAAVDAEAINEQRDRADQRSILSLKALGTTRSFRQTTGGEDKVSDLHHTSPEIETMDQPAAISIRTGFVYYFNVHDTTPIWQWAQAVLLPTAIALSWIPVGGGRVSVELDLIACREVHSVPGPDHPSSLEDVGAILAREQHLNIICPWELIFDDGVERMAVESAKDRMQWVNAISDALGAARLAGATSNAAFATEIEGVLPSMEASPSFYDQAYDAAGVDIDLTQTPIIPVEEAPILPAKKTTTKRVPVNYSVVSPSPSQSIAEEIPRQEAGSTLRTEYSKDMMISPSNEQSAVPARLLASPETIYTPRTPRSRAMFNWSSVEESELRPGDSASQRPARSQTNSSRYTAVTRQESNGKASIPAIEKKTMAIQTIKDDPPPKPARISQIVQTPTLEDQSDKGSELEVILDTIKETERDRQSQHTQQQDIARYLTELNSWLEKDVEDRSKEWKTLAMGVTQLHEDINAMKTETAMRAIEELNAFKEAAALKEAAQMQGMTHRLEHGPAAALAYSTGVDGASGALPGAYYSPAILQTPMQQHSGYVDPIMYPNTTPGFGVNAISGPGPSYSIKKSGTRTWRAEASAGSLRNNDAFTSSGSIRDKKKERADKKTEGRARRRDALKESGVAKLAAAAAGAALIAAATHEYDKHKEKQRNAGKPEEASSQIDEKTGTFVKHEEIPEEHSSKIESAVVKGDEGRVREAVKDAAEAGAGAAAIQKLMGLIKSKSDDKVDDEVKEQSEEESFEVESNIARKSNTSEGVRSAKSSSQSFANSEGSRSLEEAAKVIGAGAGGGALALAIEEILKHLLEKKEEEKNRAKEEAEVEAAREAKRKEEEEAKDKLLQEQREKDKNELVDTILAKLKQEKATQEAELAIKQKELDPKTAIESLVAAINQQRATDSAHQASSDMAIKQMAADLVRSHSEQNGKMIEAVNSAAKEMLRHNVEAHAEDLKKILSKEVSVMFDDVGKIREAKRALESEISDLFSIKARHLGDVSKPKSAVVEATSVQQQQQQQPIAPQAVPAWGQPILTAGPPKAKPLPVPMPMPAISHQKRDLVGPFSMSFGPRR